MAVLRMLLGFIGWEDFKQGLRVSLYVILFTGACVTPFFCNFLLFIFNKISLLFHLFFRYLTCLCPYSNNLMLRSTYMCRPNIVDNKEYIGSTCKLAVDIRLYEYGHEQVKLKKKR